MLMRGGEVLHGALMGALFVLLMALPTCCQVEAASAWQMLKHSVEKKKSPSWSESRFNTAECCLTRAGFTTHVKAAVSSRLKSKLQFHVWNAFSYLSSSSHLHRSHLKHRVRGDMKRGRVGAAGCHHCIKTVSKYEMRNCCITVPVSHSLWRLSASRGHGSIYLIKVKYYTFDSRTFIWAFSRFE